MLDKAAAPHRCRRFLNLATGECIRMHLPELEEHALLALTPEGLILLLDEPTRVVRLLNPLTRQLTDLPPVTALLKPEWHLERNLGKIIKVHGAGIVDASMVAVSFGCPRVLVVAKPRDERWTLVDSSRRFFRSVLPFAGRFYCATRGGIEVLNASTDHQVSPRLLMAVDWSRSLHVSEIMNDSLHLVDNAGELMLVHRMLRCTRIDNYERRWGAYKVDLDAGVLVPAKSLCGRAVFVGARRTISVSVDVFDIAADTLYFGYECGGDTYNLGSGEATYYRDVIMESCDCDETDGPCNHNMDYEWQGPLDIVSCLCDCIQGIGKELA
jgi:hypothetical protein